MRILDFIKKNSEAIMYLIFGGLTTLINIVSYSFFYYSFEISNTLSNIISWLISVTFAYITNKLFVFKNKIFTVSHLFFEIVTFFGCRILTGILDVGIMFIFVDILFFNAFFMKIISNIIVIALNYIASKFLIFRRRKRNENS